MKPIARYKNGNLTTTLWSDGTRERITEDDFFKPAFAENVDVHTSNRCDNGCAMCYANCTKDGKFGKLSGWHFLDTLHRGTEMALNLNFPMADDFMDLLVNLKNKGIITNVTINQNHFMKYRDVIEQMYNEGLIYAIGVSLTTPTPQFIEQIKKYPNAVIHVINGILTQNDVEKLADNNLKMLILGYKQLRRGNDYFSVNQKSIYKKHNWLSKNLPDIIDRFNTVSFDNLAIEQLDVHRLLTKEEWDEFYMGDDGTMTYYIDMVEQKFAKSSTAPFEKRYDLLDSVDEMFKKIVNEGE
jgi:hypothetical protein